VHVCWQKVGFPLVLDLYDFCTPELQASLAKPRQVSMVNGYIAVLSAGTRESR